MFTTLFVLAYCCSLAGSLSVDPILNEKYIDGSQHTIKSVDTTYKQHISDHGECSVKLNEHSKTLTEGEIIKIKNKWFKVEECQLNRAYPASCGSKLYYQLRDLACSVVEENSNSKIDVRRQTKDSLLQLLEKSYYNACCKTACTLSEFLQYCPKKMVMSKQKKNK